MLSHVLSGDGVEDVVEEGTAESNTVDVAGSFAVIGLPWRGEEMLVQIIGIVDRDTDHLCEQINVRFSTGFAATPRAIAEEDEGLKR